MLLAQQQQQYGRQTFFNNIMMSHQKLINQQGNTSTSTSSSSAGGCGGGGDAESIISNKESFPSISLKEKFTQMISNNFQKIPPFRIKWFISTIAIVIYSTIFNITNLIMFSKFTKNFNSVNPLAVIFLFLDVFIFLVVIYEKFYHHDNTKFTNKWSKYTYIIVCKILKKLLWLILLIACIFHVVLISIGKLSNPLNVSDAQMDILNMTNHEKTGYFVINLINLVFNGALLGIWWSTNISSVYLLFASINFINILIAISLVQINISYFNVTSGSVKKIHNLFIITGTFMTGQSAIGLSIVLLINEKNRLKDFIGKLIFFYDVYVTLLFSLLLGCTIVSGIYFDYKSSFPISICILYLCSIIISVVSFLCTRYFRLRGGFTNEYQVEEYDLLSLTPHQKQGWGKLIDINHKYNGGISGDYVISLMENYIEADLPGMTCKVLRVFKKNEPKHQNKKNLNTAFEDLDHESLLFQDTPTLCDTTSSIKHLEDEYRPLSKNQLKRLAKKNQKDKKLLELKSLENNTEIFYQELMNTEALILLTIVEEFDLVKESPVGLKPVARGAAVLYAISQWNAQHEKLTVLLDPTYKDVNFEAGITSSGWYKIKLPNSHIIDLRPFQNQTSTDYFKAIKYRTQDNSFKQAHGQVIETNVFNYENCQEIINMNQNISQNRQSSGQSQQLLQPDWEFIYNLGNFSNEKKYRSILFLKVDNQIIASCVIFRLGDTMTSDIQGLDHAISKKYKAYFVMMQEVIKIGLREGVKFIDFGPTTEEAKVTIGCNVVPLCGSIYPKNKFLGPIIKFAASKVDV
ncbi:Acetyltransferase (GNAT) domain family protein [Candida albicans]|uniref:Acetyltransferase (GNAT) domain family protein n=1 Tax=Candida albicans TaxID=5476 RepID=A0A8H6C1S5_CANAX|nr:Acetyltransferase (GNAT) domain family protein [Candida albicans]